MPDLFFGTKGPTDAPIVCVGEAWGLEEQRAQKPFVGGAGNELDRMFAEAGISKDQVLYTNIIPEKPHANQMWRFFDTTSPKVRGLRPTPRLLSSLQRLNEQISSSPRSLVIGTGNYPLWALSDVAGVGDCPDYEGRALGIKTPTGIGNWRGSMWYVNETKTPFLPIIHPAAILRQWSQRSVTVHDLKARVPMALRGDWRPSSLPTFWAPPTFDQAVSRLRLWISRAESGQRFRLVCDIETVPSRRLIACIGLTDSVEFGMAIPFFHKLGDDIVDYWKPEQEIYLRDLLRRVLTHPNILVENQNIVYDIQYLEIDLAIRIRLDFDSMAAQHLLWPGTPKDLGYISSLYCNYHWYWKEDSKEWDLKGDINQLLVYNCWDLVRTYEAITVLRQLIPQLGLERQWQECKERKWLALRMMRRGIKIDKDRRSKIGLELNITYNRLASELNQIIKPWMLPLKKKGSKASAWYTSPTQQKVIFGDLLGLKLPFNPKTKRPTLNKDALRELARMNPEFTGIFVRMEKLRSIGVFQSHFIAARLSSDGRMRCEFKTDGTETFRWSSAQNAFGEGANLQTIPAGDED